MDNCTLDCIELMGNYTYQQTCNFVKEQCQQDSVQFIQGYYCLIHQSFILFGIVAIIIFILLYLALNALTQHCLTPCVENVISRFNISPTLAGVTFLAFANGSPDVLTAILAGTSSSPSTALIPFGSIFGASLFSTAFILSAVIFNSPEEKLKIKRKQVLVPLAFYIFGIVFLILVSSIYGKMNVYLSSVLLIAYIIFISYVLKSEKKRRLQNANSLNQQKQISSGIPASEDIVTESADSGNQRSLTQKQLNEARKGLQQLQNSNGVFKLLARIQQFLESTTKWIIPPRNNSEWQPVRSFTSLIISPFVLALSQDISASFTNDLLGLPLIVYVCIPALLLTIHTLICWYKGWKPIECAFYTIYSFLLTIAWLTLVVGVLINLLQLVQLLTNINPVFLGLTCLAWANCIGDYMSVIAFAKRGRASTAISGIFSGQLFNFLIGFGASLMIQSSGGQYQFAIFSLKGATFEILSDLIVVLIICAGLIYFSLIFYQVIRMNNTFHRKEAILFRSYYVIVIIIAVVLTISTDFFQQIQCNR